jgi:trans-o-hydroxybenzylidenepyruvate hydratase-aldolase
MTQRLDGLYAIIPTPSVEGAERWDARDTVDLDETERLVGQLLADGVDGLIALGTTGECATLTRAEYDAAADCILSTVAGRVPTYVGTTALGMHEIVERMRFVRDLGAEGTLLGLPMWQPMTRAMAVSFYERLSAGLPDLSIMAYANSRAFRFGFDAEFWTQVADRAPTVTSAKFSKPDRYLEFLEASRGRIQFVPHETAAWRFAQLAPEETTACWSTCASIGPAPALAMIRAIRSGDADRARAVAADLDYAAEPLKPIVSDPETFASYNIQIEKTRMNAGEYCKAGPIRPPYDHLPDDYARAAIECGQRWSELHEKYRA